MRIIKSWVEKKLSQILMIDDEFLVNFVMNMLEEKSLDPLNPAKMQINLTGIIYIKYNSHNKQTFFIYLFIIYLF